MELRDDTEGGVGNIADKLIKQGLVTATEEVHHNFFKLIHIATCLSLLSLFWRQNLLYQGCDKLATLSLPHLHVLDKLE